MWLVNQQMHERVNKCRAKKQVRDKTGTGVPTWLALAKPPQLRSALTGHKIPQINRFPSTISVIELLP
jgi:hypothetical protein